MTHNDIDFADYHRIALHTGCETVDDVIRWADAEIAQIEMPPVPLIDVSLGKSQPVAQICALLKTLVADPNDCSALNAVLTNIATMVCDDQLSVDVAIDRIYDYAKMYAPNDDLRWAFISLAEDLSCIRDGVYWTNDASALRQPLLEAINRFCAAETDADDITKS